MKRSRRGRLERVNGNAARRDARAPGAPKIAERRPRKPRLARAPSLALRRRGQERRARAQPTPGAEEPATAEAGAASQVLQCASGRRSISVLGALRHVSRLRRRLLERVFVEKSSERAPAERIKCCATGYLETSAYRKTSMSANSSRVSAGYRIMRTEAPVPREAKHTFSDRVHAT